MRIEVANVWVDETAVYIQTKQGFIKSVPFSDYQLLREASPEQRRDFEQGKFGIRWEEIDEDLSYEGFFTKEELDLIADIKNVLDIIPAAYIAKRFFGKSRSWFINKLKGNLSNGKPAKFTNKEFQTLIKAFEQLSQEIGHASQGLRRIEASNEKHASQHFQAKVS